MNKYMLGVSALTAVSLGLGGHAPAADMARPVYTKAPPPVVPVATWTGFYAGINVGYGWGQARTDVAVLPGGPFPGGNLAPFSFNHDPRGWLAGVQLGYNWQSNRWVLGIEADIDRSGMKGTGTFGPLTNFAGTAAAAGSFHTGQESIQ